MVIENLQITPVATWLLGAGWYNGWLWSPVGLALLLVVLLGGGAAIVLALRKCSGQPGESLSFAAGLAMGLLSLVMLACVIMCATPKTFDIMDEYVGQPLVRGLAPMLGQLTPDEIAARPVLEHVPLPQLNAPPPEKQADDWSSGALYTGIGVTIGLMSIIYLAAWLACVLTGGPQQGTRQCGRAVLEIAPDLAAISPRRIFALAWLAARESIRRKVVVVFVVFVGVILMAELFMKNDSEHPSQLYITVVMNWTVYLTMLFALLLSVLSLPGDIRDKTLHTVVTKPVRKIEIIVGRVLGFTAVGTLLLAGIGLMSYYFVVHGLNHTHKLTSDMLHKEPLPGGRGYLLVGETSPYPEPRTATDTRGHTHRVTINEKGEYTMEKKEDHTHSLSIEHKENGQVVYHIGPPEGQFQARVPIYGKLSFLDQEGKPKDRGINVGDEWAYRSFIQGQTAARAIWTFSNLHADMFPPDQFPRGMPVEMTIEVFRTHKGNMEKGVAGTIALTNPDTRKSVLLENFDAEKFATDVHYIPLQFSRAGSDGKIEHYDLFRDLVSKQGELEISLQCLEYGQNFGMAQPDLYIRAADGSFHLNFVKTYVGVWLQMVLVLSLGVMFSAFVSGPVALMATLFVLILGLAADCGYLGELATGKMIGGGPFEAAERMMTQDNMTSELPKTLKTTVLQAMDQGTAVLMRYVVAVIPEFGECSFGRHLAFGFAVGPDLLARCVLRELGYVLPLLLLAYLSLKQREIAQ